MTAGLSSRPNAGTKVAFAPPTFVGLIAAAVLAGAMLGAVIATVATNKPSAQAAVATQALNGERAGERAFEADPTIVSRALTQVRADERASWTEAADVSAALIKVRADERASEAAAAAGIAAVAASQQDANRREHVRGPFAAPFTGDAQDHIGLTEKLFPVRTPHPMLGGPME